MKKIICLLMTIVLFSMNSCIDRDLIDFKSGVSLPAVNNLKADVSASSVLLSWSIPTDIPTEIKTPLAVNIQIYKESILVQTLNLDNAPTSYTYTLDDLSAHYKFIVKLRGTTIEVSKEFSSDIYSLGQTVIVN